MLLRKAFESFNKQADTAPDSEAVFFLPAIFVIMLFMA
jgi:hypothetical protein